MEYIPLKFDLMFKKVFGDPKDTSSLEYLLYCILGIKPKKIIVLPNEITSDNYYSRGTTVDLIVELDDNTKINIEVNTNMNTKIIERNLFYLCRIISNSEKKKKIVKDLENYIQINLDYDGKHKRPIMEYKLIDKESNEILTEKLKILMIDVPYFSKMCYTNSEEKEMLLGLLGANNKEQIENYSSKNKRLKEIVDKMSGFSKDEILGAQYNKKEYEKFVFDSVLEEKVKESLEKGIEAGYEEGLKDTVKNMKKENISDELISKITNLTIDQIKEIN